MLKEYLFLGTLFFALAPLQIAKAEPISEAVYVTTEDIIADIIFPSIDRKIEEEYAGNVFGWKRGRMEKINYNNDHSYDVSMRIEIPSKSNLSDFAEDKVTVRIYPSCDSPKIGCSHDFKIEIIDYKHLTQ
ncbi:hypothetical protein [Gorillibacterium sp. sgz5001074]|uniref:hypothetical protein n=1 Tax=Gorillibacterium sp. sgz5001074 TaxID=3446695 RepID=UPI003F66D9B6